MADDKWTDEEVRYFFALYADEKKKGNRPRSGMNLAGREFIVNKFEEKFGKRWIWDRFKNKVDISRKAYVKFKKLTHNRTGLVYDSLGRLEMSDIMILCIGREEKNIILMVIMMKKKEMKRKMKKKKKKMVMVMVDIFHMSRLVIEPWKVYVIILVMS
ncbi:PREDICTED: uncharacterized protein LOC106316026 isoform X2 [Brassica oleracea var. oleracea]|uniref:uncharacterized protein LOC106316026 isoform X2 n=1 Tax=Brassica oleracea var. oleracea TaxID=109376 RepID=UPI0006A71D87|nr:PREDICTED: uncharacterized protein LOC106316026 isoform X2 [Brassica oleracea var. oleracea]